MSEKHPFDLVDLGLLLFVAPLHPLALGAVVAQWFVRRSPAIIGSAAELMQSVGVPALPAPGRARDAITALLPAAASLAERPARETLALPAPAAELEAITLGELAAADNLLVVGNRGSGKTTLLQAIIAERRRLCYVLDPHSAPGKWPSGAQVIGGGSDYPAIYAHLLKSTSLLVKRSREMNETGRADFPAFTLVSDEWGSVVSEIAEFIGRDDPKPGKLLRRLLKEGRKFGISFIGAAHGDTAASLGSEGDTVAFQNSFDWIVYCGAFVRQQAPELRPPTIRNPQGGTLPLWAVAYSPTTGERRVLDLQGLTSPTPARSAAPARRSDDDLLAGLLGNSGGNSAGAVTNSVTDPVTACTSDVSPVTPVTVTPEEATIIAVEWGRNISPSIIARRLPGYSPSKYKTYKAKVDQVLALIAQRGPVPPATDAENLDEPGGDVPPAFRNIK